MNKLTFLKHWFNNDGYIEKAAIQSIISIQLDSPDSAAAFKEVPGGVFVEDGVFKTVIDGEVVKLDGDVSNPYCYMNDRFEFPKDFHPVLKGKEVLSTFGLMLFNIVIFYEALGGVVDYVNKSFNKGLIEKVVGGVMVDEPEEGEELPEGKVGVKACLKVTENCYFLEGLGQFFIKPGGMDTLSVDPSILRRRDELFAKHKDKLSDPVIFTAIVDELVDMDRAIQMSGPSKEFYINDGFISNARKRMFIAFGIEPNPTMTGWVPMIQSLDEGTDESLLPNYINTAVEGSFGRAMATGEGGSRVKEISRLISRASIVKDVIDCGSPVGENVLMREGNSKSWIGSSFLDGKKLGKITEENHKSFIGKTLSMRVPQFCTIKDGNFCQTCLGDQLGKSGDMFTAEVILIPTNFMLYEMKKAHVAGSTNVKLDLSIAIKK